MTVPIPTVDQFTETTVMAVIRKIVDYLRNDLVDGINDNDIQAGQFNINGQELSGTLTKGDGTTINIPAITLPGGGSTEGNPYPTAVSMSLSGTTINFSMTMSSGSPITASVDLSSIINTKDVKMGVLSLDIGGKGILFQLIQGSTVVGSCTILAPEMSPNTLRISGTGTSTDSQDIPIVSSVTGSVSGNNLTVGVNGVNSSPIPLPSVGGSGGDVTCEKYDNLNNVGLGIQILQDNDSKGYINITKDTSEDNTVNVIVGDVSTGVKVGKIPIVSSVTGTVSGNNLTIGVNGVNSSTIELPSGGERQIYTGSLSDLTNVINDGVNSTIQINQTFEIEYYEKTASILKTTRTTISKGTFVWASSSQKNCVIGGVIMPGGLNDTSAFLSISQNKLAALIDSTVAAQVTTESMPTETGLYFRLYV